MRAFLGLAVSLLGMKPLVLAVLSPAIFTTGIVLQMKENDANLLKAEALLAGPPPAVPLSAIRPAQEAHPFGEVTLQAQMVASMEQAFVMEGEEVGTLTYLVPLVAADAERMEIGAVLLIEGKAIAAGRPPAVDLGPGVQAEGPFGPVVMLNGRVGAIGELTGPAAEVFSGPWSHLPADLPVLTSFEGDRAGAYGPNWPLEISIFGLFAWIGGAVGLYGLFRTAVRARPAVRTRSKARRRGRRGPGPKTDADVIGRAAAAA